jgi:hypothetical protein
MCLVTAASAAWQTDFLQTHAALALRHLGAGN